MVLLAFSDQSVKGIMFKSISALSIVLSPIVKKIYLSAQDTKDTKRVLDVQSETNLLGIKYMYTNIQM